MYTTIFPPIPRDTARAAQSIFGSNNFYLLIGDHANHYFEGINLKRLSDQSGGRRNLAMLYLITIFQFVETMPDNLVPDALLRRLEWKYALHLPMNNSLIEAQALCELRQKLSTGQMERQYFQAVLLRLAQHTQLSNHTLQNVGAGRLLARVCLISRVAKAWEAINRALEALATRQPEWLLDNSLPFWFERYDPLRRSLKLSDGDDALEGHAHMIGQDGAYLLKAIDQAGLPGLKEIPEIAKLEKVWQEQYDQIEGNFRWRKATCAGCILANQNGKTISQ